MPPPTNPPRVGDVVAQSYDPCSNTVLTSWAAIVIASLLGTSCVVWGLVVLISQNNHTWPVTLSENEAEVVSFIVNLILTLTTDSLGYIHATSLRWALYREGRLRYNTNIRLLTSSRATLANSWPMNVAWIAFLIMSYASTSILLIRGPDKPSATESGVIAEEMNPVCLPGDTCISLNGMAFLVLGITLLGQAVVGSLCLWKHSIRIPTWSPNPLNNTVAALQSLDGLRRRPGRCMQSVRDSPSDDVTPIRPSNRQPSLFSVLKSVRWILLFLWGLTAITFIWGVIVLRIAASMYSSCEGAAFNWAGQEILSMNEHYYTDQSCYIVHFGMDPASNSPSAPTRFALAAQFFLAILFLCAIQAATTIALHCAELVVNMTRDENCWRSSSASTGAGLTTTPLVGVLRSWEALVLFGVKATLHWLLGQSMVPRFGEDSWYDGESVLFDMAWSRLFVLASVMAFASGFVSVLVLWRPRGNQPACWGSLQTLADLVDEWCLPSERMWWGDKSIDGGDGVRHAGTSRKPLDDVHGDALYAGMGKHMVYHISKAQA